MSVSDVRIVLYAERTPRAEDVRRLLQDAGHPVDWRALDAEGAAPDGTRLILLDDSGHAGRALQFCRRLRSRATAALVPILFILDDASPTARLASLEAGADTYLPRPFAPGELLAQVRAFLRLKELHDGLAEKTVEVRRINQRLQQTYQRIDAELELARRIQRSFLPRQLPEMPPLRFAVHYRPCERVGGDFYDVFRLDEDHVGFYVADAMGHGMPASLLTIFVKKGVRAKEIFGAQYRLVPPDEVLRALNRDLLGQGLAEVPFITMVYGLYDRRDGTLRFARAGHPHPVHIPRAGEPSLWQTPGSLLGVFDTEFPTQTGRLLPGDKLLLYTDGLAAPSEDGASSAGERVRAAARRYRQEPIQPFVDALAHDLAQADVPKDDVTLLGLEVAG